MRLKIEEPAIPQFAQIKLKKVRDTRLDSKNKINVLPKFLLRSRIRAIEWPPKMNYPKISHIPPKDLQAGILSRNIEDAVKLKKSKRKMSKLTDQELANLEKLNLEFAELKKSPLEKVDETVPYERTPKPKKTKSQSPEKLKMGKGNIPLKVEEEDEVIKLKKIPDKPQSHQEDEKPSKKKKSPVQKLEKSSEDTDHPHLSPFEPYDIATSDVELEELEKPEHLNDETSQQKKPNQKPHKTKKQKPTQETETVPIIPGTPKTQPEEVQPEKKFRIPERIKPEDEDQKITLKPWKKTEDIPQDDKTENDTIKFVPLNDDIEEIVETVVTEHIEHEVGKKPRKVIKKRVVKKNQQDIPKVSEEVTIEEENELPVTTLIFENVPEDELNDLQLNEVSESMPVQPKIISETREEVTVTTIVTDDGKPKKLRRKRIIEKGCDDKKEITEVVTIEEVEEEPVITVIDTTENRTRKLHKKPKHKKPTQPNDVVSIPEGITKEKIQEDLIEEVDEEQTIKQILRKPSIKMDDNTIEEITQDIITEKPEKHKTKPFFDELNTASIKEIDVQKGPIESKLIEEEEIIETVETPTKRIITKKVPNKKGKLKKIVTEVVEKSGEEAVFMEEQQIIDITETADKKIIKRRTSNVREDGILEEIIEEIIIPKVEAVKAKPVINELDRAIITKTDIKHAPKEEITITEEHEIIETIETPTKKIVKKRKKDAPEKVVEEIIEKPLEETNFMEHQQIVEITETPIKTVIKKKKAIVKDGVPEEVIEEIIIQKPKKEKAKVIVDELSHASATEAVIKEHPTIEEIIETVETPEKVIVKKKIKHMKKGKADKVVEEIIIKPDEDISIMKEQEIVEIIETPLKKVIRKMKAITRDDDLPEEVIEEIVIPKPSTEQAKTIVEKLERAKLTDVDVREGPKTNVDEEEEIIEIVETPSKRIIKKKKKPTTKDESEKIVEEIITKSIDERSIMEKQQIIDITETPTHTVIRRKSIVLNDDHIPEEVIEQIVLKKPQLENAEFVIDKLHTAGIIKPEVLQAPITDKKDTTKPKKIKKLKPKEVHETQEIIEVTEIPNETVVERKLAITRDDEETEETSKEIIFFGPNKEKAKTIIEQLETAKVREIEILEITETPKKRVTKKRKPAEENKPEELIEEIIHKPVEETALMEEQKIVEIKETPTKTIIRRKSIIFKEGVPEEIIEEIVLPRTKKEQAKSVVDELGTVTITQVDIHEGPVEEEIIETVETPSKVVVKKKRKSLVSDKPEEIVEEITAKSKKEKKIMEDQEITEIIETPEKKIIKKKKAIVSEDGIPQETIEEIVIHKPRKEIAKPVIEELDTAHVTEAHIFESATEEMTMIVETPTKRIIKTIKPTKKDEPIEITEEITMKPLDEVLFMEAQQIVEVTETPTKTVIKKKLFTNDENGIPEETVEEITLLKPKKEKAKPVIDYLETATINETQIIEIVETPEKRVVKTRKPSVKGKSEEIIEEVTMKPMEEAIFMEEQQIIEVTETPEKTTIKRKIGITRDYQSPEEIIEEIVLLRPQKETAKPIVDKLETANISEVQILEIVETPEKRIIKKKMPIEKNKPEQVVEEIIHKDKEEAILMEDQNIVEIKETPFKTVIRRKSITIKDNGLPEESIEEIVLHKPKKERARSITDELGVAIISETDVQQGPIEETVIQTVETPEKLVVKKRRKSVKEPKTDELIEEVTIKPTQEQNVMLDQEIVEIVETPTKKIIKKKTAVTGEDGIPQETIEEIVIHKPKADKAKKKIVPVESIEVSQVITQEVPQEMVVEEKIQDEKITPSEENLQEVMISQVSVKKAPKKPKEGKLENVQEMEKQVEEIIPKSVMKQSVKETVSPNESIETTEIIHADTTVDMPVKKPEEETATALIFEEEEKPQIIEVPVNEAPDKQAKADSIKIQEINQQVEEIKSIEPKKKKAEKTVTFKENLTTTEIIPSRKVEDLSEDIKPQEEKIALPKKDEEKVEITEPSVEKAQKKVKPVLKDTEHTEDIVVDTPEIEKPTEEIKEKKMKKKKKKPAKKEEWEEWVEPEYERPVLEKMPEKIEWEPSKKKKEKTPLPTKIEKLLPQKIERISVKPTKLTYMEPTEEVQFGTIKLKKTQTVKKKEAPTVQLPKYMLRSRITFHGDYPPEMKYPSMSEVEPNPLQNGILSRNIEEGLKLIKKKMKKVKLSDVVITELEKLDKEFDELKKVPLEEIEDKSIYERQPKKPKDEEEKPKPLVVGKGIVPEKPDEIPENIKLKKIPEKEPKITEEKSLKPKKVEPEEEPNEEKQKTPTRKLKHEDFKPIDFDRPELDKYVPEEEEKPNEPILEVEVKPPPKKPKKKPEQDLEQVPIVPGIPKPPKPEEEPEVKFRIPERPKPDEVADVITLKGWKKDAPEKEGIEEFPQLDIKPVSRETNEEEESEKELIPEKEKVPKKKKKKPRKEKEAWEEWVEPEYERPVLEPMPEKIDWVPTKKPKENDSIPTEKPEVLEEKIPEDTPEEIVLKKPVPIVEQDNPEEILIMKKPIEKSEETDVVVSIKKPVGEKKIEVIEEVVDDVTIVRKPEKEASVEDTSEKIIKKPIEDSEEIIEKLAVIPIPEKITDEVIEKPTPEIVEKIVEEITKDTTTVKKTKKKKPAKKADWEEWVEPEYVKPVLEPMPEKIDWDTMKKPKEKVPLHIEKPEVPEKQMEDEEPAEVLILKKKPIITQEDTTEELIIKKPSEKPTDKVSEEVAEEIVVVKKPKRKPSTEEAIEEIVIKKEMPEEIEKVVEEFTEEVTLKKKSKKKVPIEETTADAVIKMPVSKKEENPVEDAEITISKKPQKKPEQEADELIIQKPTPQEVEKADQVVESVNLKTKTKKKKTPKKADWEEWKEPEYERPVLEPMPEKIDWESTKKPKNKIPSDSETKAPEEITETVTITKKPKETPEEIVDEVLIKKPLKKETEEVTEEITESVISKKVPKKVPVVEDEADELIIKKPVVEKPEISEEITEEVTLMKKPNAKKITEETTSEITIKRPVVEKPEMQTDEATEEVTLKKKPKKKVSTEEAADEVTIKKPIMGESEKQTDEATEEVTLKKKPKKKVSIEEVADEVTIKKPIIAELDKESGDTTEQVTLKKKPKKKPVTEEEASSEITIKKLVKELPTEQSEVTEEITLKKKPKKKQVVEEMADEVTIQNLIVEKTDEKTEESVEEFTLKRKPDEKPVKDEVVDEVIIKKPTEKLEEISKDITEDVVLKKKSKKKPVTEEAAAEVTIKKPVVEKLEEQLDDVAEEVTLQKKSKKKPTTEDAADEVTIKKPVIKKPEEQEQAVTEAVTLKKKPKKPSVTEEAADEITVKKLVTEEPEDTVEQFTLKKKSKPKQPTLEEVEDTEITIKKKTKPKSTITETDEVSTDIKLKKKSKKTTVDEAADELNIERTENIEQPEEVVEELVEEFVVKRKPPKKPPTLVEEIYEDVTLRKLRPKRKRPDIKEITETENVTFRPRSTKTKEDVEQEFKISLNTYEEEDISMSGKVRLKPKKRPTTYHEEGGEETIRIIQGPDDDGEPIIEEIIYESEDETREEYSIDELLPDEYNLTLRKNKKKEPHPYKIEHLEEDVRMKLKKERKYSIEETDESLALKLKPKRRQSTLEEEEASLSIMKESDIYEEDEGDYSVHEGATVFSICSYVAETDEAINLVEGEKVYIIEHTNSDWWFVKKHLTQEKGWVPAQYLLDEAHYTVYLQRKLHEKIDKLPIFEKPGPGDKSSAPRFIEKLQPIHTPDGYTVQFECQVEGIPRPQITWFRQTAIIKPSPDFQIYYDEDNVATLIIREVFPEDAGMFTCVAKNAAGFASSTTELIVEAPLSDHGSDMTGHSRKSLSRESSLADILEGIPPTFSRKPKAKCVDQNTDVILECRLVAVPEPEITWYYEDVKIATKENIIVATESDMHMYCSVMKIKKVNKTQEGKYKIIAKNREGEASIEIPLKVKTGAQEPPEILEPLKPYVIREGETVVLTTQIVGTPKPNITWLKDGKPLKELIPKKDDDVNTLTLIQPTLSDSGEYSCIATNDLGTAETKATLTVEEMPSGAPEPPLFTQRFQEVTVPEKGTFKLVAKVTGNPVPEVTWLRNNKPLENTPNVKQTYDGENIILEIKNADSEVDSGDYKCIASNPVGKTSHGAKITVDVPRVTFTRKLLKEQTVDEYKILELSCETSHTMSTIWWHNDKEISGMDHREVIQEGRTHKLVIKKTNTTDEGTYKCTVKNQSTSCNVTVKPTKPEFVKKLQDFEVIEREVAILEVEITSQTADVTWKKDGELLKPHDAKLEFVKEGPFRKLFIRSTSVHDEGEYTCSLLDEECTAEVTVVELPPEIITKMVDVHIARGDKAKFDIELTKGDALVRWFKDGQELQFSEHVSLSIDGKRQKLKIYDASPNDAGIYSCQVGDQTSEARLIVEEPEVDFIRRLPDITLVPLEEDALFTIELSRSDVPVEWCRKGVPIVESDKYTIIDEGLVKKLVVSGCTVDDAVEYSAVVLNVKTSSRLKVEVIESPPKISMESPKKYKVKKDHDVDMTVRFSASPKPVDEWTVDRRVVTMSKRIIKTINDESATLSIKKVQNDDMGNYTLKLFNTHGEATTEIELLIGREPSKPEGPLIIEDIRRDCLTIKWKPPLDDGGYDITEYIIEMCTQAKKTWSRVIEVDGETLSYCVKNLEQDIEYIFKVIAKNEVGTSEPLESTPVKVKSSFEKPGSPRGPLEVSGMTKTAFTIKWKPPENDGGSPITDYIVEIKETSKKTWSKIGTTKSDTLHFNVTDLITDVAYEFRITAKNIIGIGSPYLSEEPIVAGKRITPPSCPLNFHVANITSRSVTLNWSPPLSTGGSELTGYVIEKRSLVDNESKWIKVVTLDATTHQYCVENLKESEFLFRIFAENCIGLSTPTISDQVSLKTHANVPSPPTAPLEIRQIAAHTVVIEWGRPESDGGAPLEGYKIAIRDTKKTMWIEVGRVNADIQKLIVRDLQEDHDYLIKIYARNEVGFSEPLESDEPFKIVPASELAVIEPVAEATERGETASVSYSTENTSSWLRDHNMDADISSYARARLLRKDEYFFRIWHYAKKLFK
ncbi:hypothetical protein PV327_003406 [Microctonus hyperodae]|uniref:Titin n=1 Tax=Microctonus hyperodae TaxID=165561 RepID=A0AA39G3Y3_MICHY|nr:hypothetical protein PV327_003406 [Microctonus hyperodae]